MKSKIHVWEYELWSMLWHQRNEVHCNIRELWSTLWHQRSWRGEKHWKLIQKMQDILESWHREISVSEMIDSTRGWRLQADMMTNRTCHRLYEEWDLNKSTRWNHIAQFTSQSSCISHTLHNHILFTSAPYFISQAFPMKPSLQC